MPDPAPNQSPDAGDLLMQHTKHKIGCVICGEDIAHLRLAAAANRSPDPGTDLRAECAEVCTSSCHADDCEHHGHLPNPEPSLAAARKDIEELPGMTAPDAEGNWHSWKAWDQVDAILAALPHPEPSLDVERLARAIQFVAHDRRLCKSSDFWHEVAHAEGNAEDTQARDELAAAVLARLSEESR